MEEDDVGGDNNNAGLLKSFDDSDERPRSAVNSVVLDYYKKFGRKRDLEQYFSLSTAQSDIRDPRSLFWRRMKEQSDTSDSGEKKSESSNEICRISIKCSIPERSEEERRESPSNNDSDSPPIITDAPEASPSGDESMDDNQSQKSADATLDTSINKPLSPTSSVTSQRKLEWDSLADVGYANESEQKTSASSLSTLEREVLAQKHQYTLDFKKNSDLGVPTAHSTPVDPNDSNKGKKGQGKKTISILRKDVDLVEVSVPHDMENQPINVNLTKQFSVNLQKDGGMTIDNVKKDISISPENAVDAFSPENVVDAKLNTGAKSDKEIQTSLLRLKVKDRSLDGLERAFSSTHKIPIGIGLNTLRQKQRRKKLRKTRTKLKSRKKFISIKNVTSERDKTGDQVSEAESFEYMPGHVYNQNQLKQLDPNRPNNSNNNVGNKSSLESSAVHTTDSSKESKYSFSKDLDKTLNVLKLTLKEKYDSSLKKKLVTQIIQRLLKSNYGEGETTPEFLSVLNLCKKTPPTSTSEADNTEEKVVHSKPKKSILRASKFDSRDIASTSQSAPNIPLVVDSGKPLETYLSKMVSTTTTETDLSNNSANDRTSSDTVFPKTTSQELYKKYIYALKKEEAYKQHLRDKESFLKQKLVRTEPVKKASVKPDLSNNPNLQELIKDLTRNNYDDGSGDASILEGGSSSILDMMRQRLPRKQRSHSVFTLSSGNSDVQNRNYDSKDGLQKKTGCSPRAGSSKVDRKYASTSNRPAVTDSSVQVNMNLQDKPLSRNSSDLAKEPKYVCLCEKTQPCHHNLDSAAVYCCSITKPTTSKPTCGIHSASSSLKDVNSNYCSIHPKKEKIVHECTRCLQTKFSIDPKISDPSASDINIVHSADCVKLINELYRKVSQTGSMCQCSNEKDCASFTCKSSKDYMLGEGRNDQDNLIEDLSERAPLTDQKLRQGNVQSCGGCHKAFTNQPESATDNIVIPIQGTNMMLKLSIGGKSIQIPGEQTNEMRVSKNIDKDIQTGVKASILDDCCKYVQPEKSSGIFSKSNQDKDCSPQEPIIHEGDGEKENGPDTKTGNFTSARNSGYRSSSNTYPKKVKISEKKPLLRPNTDLGKLGAGSEIQTEVIYIKDKETTVKSKSMGDRTQSESVKKTPSDHSTPESSKSSTRERFHSCNALKNKFSGDGQILKQQKDYEAITGEQKPKDLIMDVISDITKRYSKQDTDKRSKKKCFKEIVAALSYLLDTDDSGDGDQEFRETSEDIQCSKEQSSQSECSHGRKKSKVFSDEKSSNVPVFSANILGQKSNTYERNNKVTSASKQHRRYSEATSTADTGVTFSKMKDSLVSEAGAIHSFERNKGDGKYSLKPVETGDNSKPSNVIETCEMGCGCDGSSDCKDCFGPNAAKYSNSSSEKCTKSKKGELRCHFPDETKATCVKECSCGGSSGCNDCMGPQSSTYKLDRCDIDPRPKSTVVGCVSPKKRKNKCDKGSDGDSSDLVETYSTKYKTELYKKGYVKSKTQDRCNSPIKKETCDKGCGCDGSSECSECGEPNSARSKTGKCGKESSKPKKEDRCNSPIKTKTCDIGCGCDGSSECTECGEPHSPRSRTEKCGKTSSRVSKRDRCVSPIKKTSDKGCGCDGSSECTECVEQHSARSRTGKCNESPRSKKQNKCNSPIKTNTNTCDKGCGSDGSSKCIDCAEPQSPRSRPAKCGKDSPKLKRLDRSNSPIKTNTKTCDKDCSCDVSSQCGECVKSVSSKYRTAKCGKESPRPKKQDRCSSPKKIETCDRGCGFSGSSECSECVESSSKYRTGKCGKESPRLKKQDKCNSPKKIQTYDRSCGCDGSSECSDCVEPHSMRKCDKKSPQPKKQYRCNSPNRSPTTCDKTCGCKGTSECKECHHKTGRCCKEISRSKKQEAKKFVNKCVQSTVKRVRSFYSHCDESSDLPISTDPPYCSYESPTSKLVHKIKKECEKYQKRKVCKKCEASSSTAVSCDHCKRAEKHKCRLHRCRCHRNKSTEKIKKKCVAYNLIVQTSDSLISEDTVFDRYRPLQNVIVRVPKCRQKNIPFKEACAKIEQKLPFCDMRFEPKGRSQSWPNECGISSTDDVKIANACTVRDYLEKNRPDFVDRCETRQNCIKMTSESRAKERSELREQLVGLGSLPSLTNEELIYLAKQLGFRRKRPLQQKIISERDMKKHSENIYKSLPEVVQKKEDAKKESIKKTNLLMANIFKKNLQKKVLSGDVNISNYSQVVKI